MTSIFAEVVNMSSMAIWLILAVIVVRLLCRKATKNLCYLLWALVGIRLLCPFTIESSWSLIPNQISFQKFVEIQNDIQEELDIQYTEDKKNSYEDIKDEYEKWQEKLQQGAVAFEKETGGLRPIEIVTIVWGTGVLLILGYTIISFFRLKRKVAVSVRKSDGIWLCDAIHSPFVLGVFKPRVYVPSEIEEEQITYILAHEKSHLKWHDNVWKLVGLFILAIHWFNPLVWLAYALLCRDIELACDERVVKTMDEEEKRKYVKSLLLCSSPTQFAGVGSVAFGEISIRKRIKGVLNYKKASFWRVLAAVVICFAVIVGFMTNPKGQEFVAEVEKEIQEELDKDVTYGTAVDFTKLKEEIRVEMEVAKEGKYENLNILCDEVRFPESGQIKEMRFSRYEFTKGMSLKEKLVFYKDIVYPKLFDVESVKTECVMAWINRRNEYAPEYKDYTYLMEHADELERDENLEIYIKYIDDEAYQTVETIPEGICFNLGLGKLSRLNEENSPFSASDYESVKVYNCYSDDLSDAYPLMDGTLKTVAEAKKEIESYLDAHYPLVGEDNGVRNEVYEIEVGKIPNTEYYVFDASRTLSYEGCRVREYSTKRLHNEVVVMAQAFLCESNKVDALYGFVNCFEKGSVAKVYEEYASFADVMENVSLHMTKNIKFDVIDIAVEYRMFSERDGEESYYRWVPYWSFLMKNPNNNSLARVYVNIETGKVALTSH